MSEWKPMMDEADRRKRLEQLRPSNSPTDIFREFVWSDIDIARLRAAFQKRFDEPLPRTETLMAVAAEGIRIYAEHSKLEPLPVPPEQREKG